MKAENGKQQAETPAPSIKSTHTPGPWKVQNVALDDGRRATQVCTTLNGTTRWQIATVMRAAKETAANAALIAAAPDILAALKNAAIALRFYAQWMTDNSNNTQTEYPFGKDAETAARAALARAEGSQP